MNAAAKWNTQTITYSFYNNATSGPYAGNETGVTEVSEPVKANIRTMLKNCIEPFLNVEFVEVDDTATSHGQVRYLFSDGPTLDRLTLIQDGANTLIQKGQDILAVLQGVRITQITTADFA
jgi:hypothetical protein